MKKKQKPLKETGVGVSSMAGYWMNKLEDKLRVMKAPNSRTSFTRVEIRELKMIVASALSQDETKGQN